MLPKFTESDFRPTPWSSAKDKARFANWLVKFIDGRCPENKFPQWAYENLSNTFGFIAHYNRLGFCDTYFQNAQTRSQFIDNMASYPWAGVNPEHTYGDVEIAVIKWIKQANILARYSQEAALEREGRERALLAALQKKYAGIEPSPQLQPQPPQLNLFAGA